MIEGGCLCGAVRFEIDKVRSLTHCHCVNCRKPSGASFATDAHVEADAFRFTSGADRMRDYESSPGSRRTFCTTCGCPTPSQVPYPETISIPAGLLDDDPGVRPLLHVFTSSKAPFRNADYRSAVGLLDRAAPVVSRQT